MPLSPTHAFIAETLKANPGAGRSGKHVPPIKQINRNQRCDRDTRIQVTILNVSSGFGSFAFHLISPAGPVVPIYYTYISNKAALKVGAAGEADRSLGFNATRMNGYTGTMSPANGCKIIVKTALEKEGTAVLIEKDGDRPCEVQNIHPSHGRFIGQFTRNPEQSQSSRAKQRHMIFNLVAIEDPEVSQRWVWAQNAAAFSVYAGGRA
ncbi:hypothetical protein C8R44DRAFT_740719 [Mycena epipterygia]|nr:hypothetical protein C8R44DRAFT_740719 [Mycena epipterygia]